MSPLPLRSALVLVVGLVLQLAPACDDGPVRLVPPTSAAPEVGVPAGTVLTPSGPVTTSRDGQVIEGLDVSGTIRVEHDDVTIRRVRVVGDGIDIDPSTRGTRIEDCELDGTPTTGPTAAVAHARYEIRRCDIHHFGEGLTASGDVVIEHNMIHDFKDFIASGAHQDGVQIEWGSNVVVRGNVILMDVDGANSAVWVSSQPHDHVVIEDNLLAGASFTIGAGNQAAVRDNRISTRFYPEGGFFGPITFRGGTAVVTGNVWAETGAPIP